MRVLLRISGAFLAAALIAAASTVARAQTDRQPGGVAPPPASGTYLGGPIVSNPPPAGPGVPRDDLLEVMVKGAIISLNDANLVGNYAVLNARLHPEFGAQVPADRLAGIFAPFRTNRIDMAPALVHRPVYTEAPSLDSNGFLVAKGKMETRPWITTFDLAWRRHGDQWLLWKLNVFVGPPTQ